MSCEDLNINNKKSIRTDNQEISMWNGRFTADSLPSKS